MPHDRNNNCKIGFVGSVAFNFSDIIEEIMLKHDLKNNEYNHWIISIRNLKPDEIVVFLTYIGHITVNK